MSLTHRDLAILVSSLYGKPGSTPTPWLYRSNLDANVHMGIVRRGGYLNVITRGSFDEQDWWHNFDVRKFVPLGCPQFKRVHEGMYSGTAEAADIVEWYTEPDDKLNLAGHSLGGDRATQLAGHMVIKGHTPNFICTWGEPAGAVDPDGLPLLIAGIPCARYRSTFHGRVDRVTTSTLAFGFMQCSQMIDLAVTPADPEPWDPFELHHFDPFYLPATPETEIQ
jgi:hypothetical protein